MKYTWEVHQHWGVFFVFSLVISMRFFTLDKVMCHSTASYLIRSSENGARYLRCKTYLNVYSIFRISAAVTYRGVPFEKLVGMDVVALSPEEKFLTLSGR